MARQGHNVCNHNYLPNFEHSIVIIVKVVGEGGSLDVKFTHQLSLVTVLEEVQLALTGIVDGKSGFPGLSQTNSSYSQQRY